MKNMYKIYLSLIFLFIPLSLFASNVDVIANPSSGTYHTPIHISLTPTQSGSKTFYSFKPDGYPQDAFLYEKPILLKHSSPFIYFSIVSTSNESKIKQNDYIIEYPSTIYFETETISGSGKMEVTMVNSGSESVNIGYWQIQSESDMVIIPKNTLLIPGEKYSVNIMYLGTSSVVLRSPDDDERDILTPKYIPLKKEKIIIKTVPRKIISTQETTSEDIETLPKVSDIPVVQIPTEKIGATTPTPSTSLDINQLAKASATESGQKNINPLYFIVLLMISAGVGGIQWFIYKQKQK